MNFIIFKDHSTGGEEKIDSFPLLNKAGGLEGC
jgi:hypothetical protein